jgi:hypothetical protein
VQEKKSTRVTKDNRYAKRILCEIAWSITRIRKTYLSSWYWKVKQRRGSKKAIIALARKILTILSMPYTEQQEKLLQRRQKALIKELTQQGFSVIPPIV